MNETWQSWAALAVVVITALIFLQRALRPRPKGSCGGSCACSMKPTRTTPVKADDSR